MTDRELLELAAKAAGIEVPKHLWADYTDTGIKTMSGLVWNPLTDDGHALRLAVKLGMILAVRNEGKTDASVHIENHPHSWQSFLVEHNDDSYAATRRAIVRAAAEIGKGMK